VVQNKLCVLLYALYAFVVQKKLCALLYALYAFVVQKKLCPLLYALYAFVVQKKTLCPSLCPLCLCGSKKNFMSFFFLNKNQVIAKKNLPGKFIHRKFAMNY
jgi:hypothetical protein